MGFLVEPIQDMIHIGKRRFRVNAAFDIVLEVQRLYKEELPDGVKVMEALKMFGIGRPERFGATVCVEALNDIYKNCINTKQRPPVRQKVPVLDFEEDGEYIYASFMLDYGIDLIDMQGLLHWKKFIALFQGLSEQSKISEVMRIRGMDIPKFNGKNQEQIRKIQELKSYYALPVKGGGGQNGLDLLFSTLERMAVRNE